MKRAIVLILTAVLLITSAIGCGAEGVPRPTATTEALTGEGSIEFWTMDLAEGFMLRQEEWVTKFEEKYPAIKVNMVALAETELTPKLESEPTPDVLVLPLERVAEYYSKGVIDEEASSKLISEIGEAKFEPGLLEMAKSATGQGAYAAVPWYGWVQGIWYRKDLFEERSLDPPDSWEHIREAAEALHDPSRPLYGIVMSADPEENYTYHVLEHLAVSNGACPFASNGTPNMEDRPMIETLKFYSDLAQYSPSGASSRQDARRYFIDGQAAMIFGSTYLPEEVSHLEGSQQKVLDLPEKMVFIPIIEGADGEKAGYGSAWVLAIMKDGNLEASRTWIAYLTKDAYNVYWVPMGATPVFKGFASQWLALRSHDWFSYYAESGMPKDTLVGLVEAHRWSAKAPGASSLISRMYAARLIPQAISRMLSGEMTPEETAGWLQDEVTKMK